MPKTLDRGASKGLHPAFVPLSACYRVKRNSRGFERSIWQKPENGSSGRQGRGLKAKGAKNSRRGGGRGRSIEAGLRSQLLTGEHSIDGSRCCVLPEMLPSQTLLRLHKQWAAYTSGAFAINIESETDGRTPCERALRATIAMRKPLSSLVDFPL